MEPLKLAFNCQSLNDFEPQHRNYEKETVRCNATFVAPRPDLSLHLIECLCFPLMIVILVFDRLQ